MPSWSKISEEIKEKGVANPTVNPFDAIRRKYLAIMHQYTGRNVIAYYSGFLQNHDPRDNVSIDDTDKNAFMQTIYGLDKTKGLDLILHTPGGRIDAAESLIKYLKAIFGKDTRAFIPQMAMSAGTMIALSCKEIVMGKESNIGPIDPQFGGVSCEGIIEEFNKAIEDIKLQPASAELWKVIISKYHPTFLGDCKKAIDWSQQIVKESLKDNMLEGCSDNDIDKVIENLGSHDKTYSHNRHIHIDECLKYGLKVTALESFEKKNIEDCEDLQDCVLTIHHAYMHTFANTLATKIVENHEGNAMITMKKINLQVNNRRI